MRRLFDAARKERGASVVEYSVVMALIIIVSIPAMGRANEAVSDAFVRSTSSFASTGYSYAAGGGGGGGGGTTTTTTTTVPPTTTTTTTTVPPTTTTTTTTTVPPTTTTTTTIPDGGQGANQTKTATYGDEISVTFWETDGVVTFGSVQADGWTYEVTKDKERRQNLEFTNTTSGKVVQIKGWLNKKDVLKTKVT
ncbi:MAG: hypothetical protein ACC683_12205 [Acidimicrobiia bacterium]